MAFVRRTAEGVLSASLTRLALTLDLIVRFRLTTAEEFVED